MSIKRNGSIFAIVVLAGSVGYLGAQTYVNKGFAKDTVREMADKIEQQADNGLQIDFAAADIPIFGDRITVSGVELKNADGDAIFSMNSVTMTAEGFVDKKSFPVSADFSIKGFEIVSDRVKQGFIPHLETNYASNAINASFGFDFVESDDTLSGYAKMSVPDVSDISAEISLSGVADVWNVLESNYVANEGKIDLERKEEREVQKASRNVGLKNANVTYENKGEMELFVANVAEKRGVEAEEVKERMLMAAERFAGDLEFAGEIETFIKEPKSLSVSLSPEEAMSFQEIAMRAMASSMGNAKNALSDLNLTVKAN